MCKPTPRWCRVLLVTYSVVQYNDARNSADVKRLALAHGNPQEVTSHILSVVDADHSHDHFQALTKHQVRCTTICNPDDYPTRSVPAPCYQEDLPLHLPCGKDWSRKCCRAGFFLCLKLYCEDCVQRTYSSLTMSTLCRRCANSQS